MLPPLTVPAGLVEVLQVTRGAFTAPSLADAGDVEGLVDGAFHAGA